MVSAHLFLLFGFLLGQAVTGQAEGNHQTILGGSCSPTQRPNFIYIISDDQDAGTATPEIMPLTSKHIAEKGSNYTNFFTPVSLCCPSRAGFFRSQHAHNHNVTWVAPPFGGWQRFVSSGFNTNWLPTWLQAAGYQTFYAGKLMNGNTNKNAETLPAKGWSSSTLLLDPFTYTFYNSSYSVDGGRPEFNQTYSTDRIRDISINYLHRITENPEVPFFLGIAPIGPHAYVNPKNLQFETPVPAERHAHLFNDSRVPRTPSFNPEVLSGASWIRQLPRLNDTVVNYIDHWYRQRLRSIQSVDELVEALVLAVEELGLANNTYIIYTSDNGFATGTHRRHPSKSLPYEEDIRVPFFIRGPGIKPSQEENSAHSNIDISSTVAFLAGATTEFPLDGRIMPWGSESVPASSYLVGDESHHLSEYWTWGVFEGRYALNQNQQFENTTYRVLRVIEEGLNWSYQIWCTGERELYDMKADSDQMHNFLQPLNEVGPFSLFNSSLSKEARIAIRMDALTLFLKSCKGSECRQPWKYIFPSGEVTSLKQALDSRYDEYFDSLPKVSYQDCRIGFQTANEGPFWSTDLPYDEEHAILQKRVSTDY